MPLEQKQLHSQVLYSPKTVPSVIRAIFCILNTYNTARTVTGLLSANQKRSGGSNFSIGTPSQRSIHIGSVGSNTAFARTSSVRDGEKGEGVDAPPNHDKPDEKIGRRSIFYFKTGRKVDLYRPINSQSSLMELIQFTIQRSPFVEQNSKNFRAFGAI